MPGLTLSIEQVGRLLQGEPVETQDDQDGYLTVYLRSADDERAELDAHLEQIISGLDEVIERLPQMPIAETNAILGQLRQALVDA